METTSKRLTVCALSHATDMEAIPAARTSVQSFLFVMPVLRSNTPVGSRLRLLHFRFSATNKAMRQRSRRLVPSLSALIAVVALDVSLLRAQNTHEAQNRSRTQLGTVSVQ